MEYERVKYNKCPLVEVTYQLNFPAILSIEANEPVAFQEAIRAKYPIYDLKNEQQNEILVNVESTKADAFFNQQHIRKLHYFISEDQQWRVTLAKDMLAFSTVNYLTWEDMTARAVEVLKAFVEVYRPSYFSRMGLRYIDAIERQVLGLENASWNELLKPHLCGCLSYNTDGIAKVRNSNVNAEIEFEDIFVNVSSGLGTIDHHNGNIPSEAFILNCDYYTARRIAVEELMQTSEMLHARSHSFFRESITDKLHYAMEPEEIKI